jgi:hypothetical protein
MSTPTAENQIRKIAKAKNENEEGWVSHYDCDFGLDPTVFSQSTNDTMEFRMDDPENNISISHEIC